MIRFFRRVRQRVLIEGKFSKYLLYAIGEIALVVIGILFALQLNLWKEEASMRDQEVITLRQLREEFSDNLIQLDAKISMRSAMMSQPPINRTSIKVMLLV